MSENPYKLPWKDDYYMLSLNTIHLIKNCHDETILRINNASPEDDHIDLIVASVNACNGHPDAVDELVAACGDTFYCPHCNSDDVYLIADDSHECGTCGHHWNDSFEKTKQALDKLKGGG